MIACHVSGHGFGHASRTVAVINALRNLRPGLRCLVSTTAPRALVERALTESVEWRALECDTGLEQIDSLNADESASLRRAAAFHADLPARAAREAAALRATGVELVVGDIPPLAFAAAEAAGLPSVALGNFTWDWIYEAFTAHVAAYPTLVPTIRRAYASASLVLRLPMHGGFAGLDRTVRDIPLIARRSRRGRNDVRRALGLPDRPLILVSFGGYGIRGLQRGIPAKLPEYGFLVTDEEAPENRWWDSESSARGNVFHIGIAELDRSRLGYEDLVCAADVVVTKPGYGIVSECIANDTALLYTNRGRFPEYDVLVAGMQRHARSEFIDRQVLLSGEWRPSLDRLLAQPSPTARPRLDGAEVAAEMILEVLER